MVAILFTVYGVFARKTIPNRTQFGPVEGVIMKSNDSRIIVDSNLALLVETESGEMCQLDVSNEGECYRKISN